MNYLTLDLPNGNLVLSDNSVWKSLSTWLDGGTLYSDYYDASNKGDYWKASEHWIDIDSSSTYLSFTIEYDFVNASATDSCLCQIKYDETIYGIAVTADSTGLNIQGAATIKHVDCDYSNANIKIDIVANLLTKEIITYIHRNDAPLIKVANDSSSYTFTKFVIQAGALGADTYKLLPTTTKLLNVSVSDDDITYSNFTDAINYVNKFGVAEIWANTKNYVAAQLLGKSNTGHTHTKSEITDFPTIPTKTSDLNNDSGYITGVAWNDVSDKPSTFTPSSHTHNYAGSSNAGGAASSTLKLETYKQSSTTETYGANYPIFAQWVDGNNVALKCTNYTVCVDKANSVAWGNVTGKPSFATVATSGSYTDLSNKPTIPTVNNAMLTIQQNSVTVDTFTANSSTDKTVNISVPTNTSELTNGAGFITADYAIPRSGGAVMTGSVLGRTVDDNYLNLRGSNIQYNGASIWLYGKDMLDYPGQFWIGASNGALGSTKWLVGTISGTLTWNGQPIQYVSDQRLKQQITEIDDKLLDAWQDVELCQFKYNDAVEQKGKDKARLHTGFVVQQIDSACKKHGVDISAYGLYCHEEYPQEVEEVEVEQKDGTKTKEKKVIREASEHYSLRYTEALIVECKYLRRCVERLTARIEELEKGNNSK